MPPRADPSKTVGKELSSAGLGAVRRFLQELPSAAREWPKQAWDMVRSPADFVLGGSPEELALRRDWEGSGMVPLPTDPILSARRGPERRARQVVEFINPIANAVFAPKQTLALASSPVGQATLGGLAALAAGMGPMASTPAMAGVLKPKTSGWRGFGGELPDSLARKFEERAPLEGSPEQLKALEAYIHSQVPFKPHATPRDTRLGVEYLVSKGHMSPEQAENIEGTRKVLNDLLDRKLELPGPIYRGMNLDPDNLPAPMRVIGGRGPASFSYDPLQAKIFTQPVEGKKRVLVQGLQDSGNEIRGLILPKGFGSAEHEREVILHPSSNVVVEKRLPVIPDEEFGDLHYFEGFLDRGLPPDIEGWAEGGLITHDPRVPGGGIRGNSLKASIKSQPVPTSGTTPIPQDAGQLGPRAETQPIRTASQLREILEQLMQEHEYA